MTPLRLLLRPIGRAVVAFFRHDVGLKRSRDGIQVVLKVRQERVSRRRKRDAAAAAKAERERQELAQMLAELDALLAEQPVARQTLRHLIYVRDVLARKGLKALRRLPLEVLQRALSQFEGMVTNWSPTGLANLRSKMAVAIIDRERDSPDAEADAYRTAAVLDSELPGPSTLPEVEVHADDQALAAAYAAFSAPAPGSESAGGVRATAPVAAPPEAAAMHALPVLEYHLELGSPSAKVMAKSAARAPAAADPIDLRVLQD